MTHSDLNSVSAKDKPFRGVGIEWTETLEEGILERAAEVECLELIPENFFEDNGDQFLRGIARYNMPVFVHSVELSLGSTEPLKRDHLEKIKEVIGKVNTVNYSEHISFTEAGGTEIGLLTPLPWTMDAADTICRKIEEVMKSIDVPFLIEHIANRFHVPFAEMTETEFVNLIVRRTGCGLLLDLHNIHADATNFHTDPYEWLAEIDLERLDSIHIAGGYFDEDGTLVDSHSKPAPPEVWDLYRHVCEKSDKFSTIIEWTHGGPKIETVLAEVAIAKQILEEARHGIPRVAGGAR